MQNMLFFVIFIIILYNINKNKASDVVYTTNKNLPTNIEKIPIKNTNNNIKIQIKPIEKENKIEQNLSLLLTGAEKIYSQIVPQKQNISNPISPQVVTTNINSNQVQTIQTAGYKVSPYVYFPVIEKKEKIESLARSDFVISYKTPNIIFTPSDLHYLFFIIIDNNTVFILDNMFNRIYCVPVKSFSYLIESIIGRIDNNKLNNSLNTFNIIMCKEYNYNLIKQLFSKINTINYNFVIYLTDFNINEIVKYYNFYLPDTDIQIENYYTDLNK